MSNDFPIYQSLEICFQGFVYSPGATEPVDPSPVVVVVAR